VKKMDKFVRGSGVAGLVGSLALIASIIMNIGGNGDRATTAILNGAGALLLLASVVSLFVAGRKSTPRLGQVGLALATLGLIGMLTSAVSEIVVVLGGQELDVMWPLFVAGLVGMLLGMSLYSVSAAWAGLAPAWSVLALVVGGGGSALIVLLLLIAPDAMANTVGEAAWTAGGVLNLVFLAGWAVYAAVLVVGKVRLTAPEKEGTSWTRQAPAAVLVALVAAWGITWAALALFAPGQRVAADAPTPTPVVSVRTPNPSARPVVIDTDMGPDDWMAILYLLQRDDVNVKAITVAGTGLTHCEPGTRNARSLLALAGYPAIPVACGSETAAGEGHSFPAEWRRGADALQGLTLPDGGSINPRLRASRLLVSLADRNRGKLTVIALGPLTNLSEAIEEDPLFAERVAGIYVMGGAVSVPGNVSEAMHAEWNIYADPLAASNTLQSGAPVTLVPLDATNSVPVTTRFVARLGERLYTPSASFVYDLLRSNRTFVESGDYFFWDPMAAAILIDESLATFQEIDLSVVEGGSESGRTLRADNGAKVRVAVKADGARFEQLFVDTLAKPVAVEETVSK
jgi:pyrimidine-specific ribonucleoside hydrolase